MTTAAPVTFGGFTVPEDSCYWEWWVNVGTGGTAGQGAGLDWYIATIAMPWAGTLTASWWHMGVFDTGVGGLSTSPYGTATSDWHGGRICEYYPAAYWTYVPYQAQWRDLAGGTVVNAGLHVQNDIANGLWNPQYTFGTMRAFRI